jgi:SAM-dependent methyltransferase
MRARSLFSPLRGSPAQEPPERPADPVPATPPENPLFPRLRRVLASLAGLSRKVYEPADLGQSERIRMLEAKVEYLLNETYRLKSIQRLTPGTAEVLSALRAYQISTFEFQWTNIVYHDEFLSNPAWREKAPQDVCDRLGVERAWFAGKKVLDCGCGPGRHVFAFAAMGARVTAFDLAERTLDAARAAASGFSNVTIDKHSILDPLPYPMDYDVVWSYGVLHHTGDTLRGLKNIARHVRPGGKLYVMLYAEPRRDNVFDFQYQHEVATIREATRALSFADKANIYEQIDGPTQTLAWFDAISSEINDLYTFEEIAAHLNATGFTDVRRTMPHETMHNVVATRAE